MNLIEKFEKRVKDANSLLCVGLDSAHENLPPRFLEQEFPQFEFNKWIIGETAEYTASYKINIAFYEARGDQGIRELKMTMEYLTETCPEIFTICDAKRADIENTNVQYVKEIFDWLEFDAVTLNPYLGREALQPFLNRKDKISIILCRTSNPGAGEFQDLGVGHPDSRCPTPGSLKPLWQVVAEKVANDWNENNNCMLVVGATYPEEMKKIRETAGEMTFLVPGIGAQGGDLEKIVKAGLNKEKRGLMIVA